MDSAAIDVSSVQIYVPIVVAIVTGSISMFGLYLQLRSGKIAARQKRESEERAEAQKQPDAAFARLNAALQSSERQIAMLESRLDDTEKDYASLRVKYAEALDLLDAAQNENRGLRRKIEETRLELEQLRIDRNLQ